MGIMINDIINDGLRNNLSQTKRISYAPYKFEVAKKVWLAIASQIIRKDMQFPEDISECWNQIIRYIHADSECAYDLEKSICLMGRTGSGKSVTMRIMQEYMKIDDVKYIRNGKVVTFNFRLFSAKEINGDYVSHGYEGIHKYTHYPCICIDDLGSEEIEVKHYGTPLKVTTEIIEERYRKGLITHYTTNFNDKIIKEAYNDRVLSRMEETTNKIKLNDTDFRMGNKSDEGVKF